MEILKIAIIADHDAFQELEEISGVEWMRLDNIGELSGAQGTEALIFLRDEIPAAAISRLEIPVILNSVITPLHELGLNGEVIRINGWSGFLRRGLWEISGHPGIRMKAILAKLNKETVEAADEPGLVTARVIAMIVNEAYFALEENVSTREEIDIALKLGTNYPYGPFEWSRKIGVKRIYQLLSKLSETDIKYKPSPLLKKEAEA